ncbi:DNA-binding GntR family transcriptional regulator [Pseudarthrobacter defluvii]|uniref:GntR family transcriptional regulator n=1 Tax=Pseudarthrobacter defluvii TaxID=410837 RepID=UPI00278482C4|nr:GntR family transcriptional regulator [Pseudarthrobacter defluvii]MDQ0769475.1 DNA-binding GntR family transcriptional regulator [Pseudarthrobacter defluvii]
MAVQLKDLRPLAEKVYDLITADIATGKIASGTALVQEQVAAQYGVSRTPVRDVLTRLTLEGLTTLVPGRGYVVNQLDESEIADVFDVRYALEALAVHRACGHYTPQQMLRMSSLIEETALIDPSDNLELFRLGQAFHIALVGPAGNSFLLSVLTSVWNHPIQKRITMTYRQGEEYQNKVVDDHRRILNALKNGDADQAIELLRHCHDVTDPTRAQAAPAN